MEIDILYNHWKQSTGIVTDSRKVNPGCIFFALKGDKFDGNTFAYDAIESGADFVVVDDTAFKNNDNARVIWVEDALETLQHLAGYHRSQLKIPFLAITGSNGKTTTKELTRDVLSAKYKVYATIGNLNNHIGVPLTILSISDDIEFAIIEMGANHQGEIDMLCNIARPDYGVITNIGKAHLEGFGGVEGIKRGKSEMYRYVAAADGHIFVNMDDEILKSLLPTDAHLLTFHASVLHINAQNTDILAYQYKDKVYQTHLYGTYNLSNIAFAIACGQYFGVAETDIHTAIMNYKPENNRSQILEYNGNKIILDAYNANPSSMKASIESFVRLGGDQVIVIGDMFELGAYSQEEHLALIRMIEQYNFIDIIYIGPMLSSLSDGHKGHFFTNISEAKAYFVAQGYQNKKILLKGSRGISVEKILE